MHYQRWRFSIVDLIAGAWYVPEAPEDLHLVLGLWLVFSASACTWMGGTPDCHCAAYTEIIIVRLCSMLTAPTVLKQ